MKHFKSAIIMTLLFIIFTGFGFPALMFVIGRALPNQADGSLVSVNGNVVGSGLIGQQFAKPEYFHPRPSAAGSGYDANNSGGTNLGPTSDKLINGVHDPKNPSGDFDGVKDLAIKYRQENGLPADAVIPSDAVTRSASGLDPAISVDNADLQAKRVAEKRNMPLEQVKQLIAQNTDEPFLGIFGAPSVNVLKLNLALDHK
jgi:K+-transporting ATPase ATPase C chain